MLSALERKDEYVMKMVRNFDEKLKAGSGRCRSSH